jgi:hypothetical protein
LRFQLWHDNPLSSRILNTQKSFIPSCETQQIFNQEFDNRIVPTTIHMLSDMADMTDDVKDIGTDEPKQSNTVLMDWSPI